VTFSRCAGRHAAVARARVHGFADGAVALALGKALRPGLLAAAAEGGRHCWRIDRDEASSIFVRLRRSLMGAHARAPLRVGPGRATRTLLQAASHAAILEAGRALRARHPWRTLARLSVQGLSALQQRRTLRHKGTCRGGVQTPRARATAGLFARGDAQARKLRRLVVDLQAPATPLAAPAPAGGGDLNAEQQTAVDRRACPLVARSALVSPASLADPTRPLSERMARPNI